MVKMFDWMLNKIVVMWNLIIVGYIENGDVDVVWEIFNIMFEKNIVFWNMIIGGLV